MNELNKILFSIVTIFFLSINNIIAIGLFENNAFQTEESEILVTNIKKKRQVPLNVIDGNVLVYEGATINFKSKKSFFNYNNNTSYKWFFNPSSYIIGHSINHTFNTLGKHSLTLEEVDGKGNRIISKLTIEVKAKPVVKQNRMMGPILINDAGDAESSFSLEQLVEDVLITGNCSTVDEFSIQVSGAPTDTTTKNYGYFKRGDVNFPFEEGIIISTGNAFQAGNVAINQIEHPDFDNNLPADLDIQTALGLTNTLDASFVKFNFTPLVDTISFRYIMASEEYDPVYECDYSDGFAFLLREVGTANYTNIAVLPDGTPVRVTNINNSPDCGINQEFFEGYELGDTNYYGRTKVLTATSAVRPGVTYEIKLVVADDQDASLDSAIFIEGSSFNLGGDLGDDVTIANNTAGCEDVPVILSTQSEGATHTWYFDGVEIPGAGTGETITVTEPGTYSVDIDFGATSCVSNDSVIVEFIPFDDATFEMVPNCTGGVATNIVTAGGEFSFDLLPTDGAIIDTVTGEITNGTSLATYTVKYSTLGDCPATSTQTVTLLDEDDATFTITAECDGATVLITGTAGGVFTFNPIPTDGASIDPATGEISNGVPGTEYTIEYTTQGVCTSSTSQTVTLLLQDDPGFSVNPTCDGGIATITGTVGGIFTFNPLPTDGAVINATTGTITNGIPGATYTIEYTTQGACSNNLILSFETLPPGDALFTFIPTCDGGEVTITGTPGGVFTFNPIPTDGAIINTTTGVVTNGVEGATYTIVYTVNNCFAEHSESFTILPLDPLNSPIPLLSCDDSSPGESAFFDLESKNMEIIETTVYTDVTYHDTQVDADSGNNPLDSPYFSNSRIVFVRAQQSIACYDTTTLELIVQPIPTTISHTYELCDDAPELDNDTTNDSTEFDLNSQTVILLNGQDAVIHDVSYHINLADTASGSNPLISPYTNTVNSQTIYYRIENSETLCFSVGEMVLQVNPLPQIELEDTYVLCLDDDGAVVLPTPVLDTGLSTDTYSFEWFMDDVLIAGETSGTLSPNEAGDYSVTVTNINSGCTSSDSTMIIESAPPTIQLEQVSITFVEDNTILATATNTSLSSALFEFKLDDGEWVSNVPNNNTYTFENVLPGPHVITARDIGGCGEASATIIVIDFLPYFTPNGDGYHDTWNIIGLEDQPDAKLFVFDRYGKLLKQFSTAGNGWNGTYNNNLMPTSDYWFTLQYRNPNTNNLDTFKSHFTLKR